MAASAAIVLAMAFAAALFAGCSVPDPDALQAATTPSASGPDRSVLSEAKGRTLAKARLLLESNGWTVKTRGTKDRSIKKSDEKNWRVTKVGVSKKTTVTLTAGKLTTKTVVIAFKTKKMKLPIEPTTYKEVVQNGANGKRKITYLDGKKLKTSVTKKPRTRIIQVGTRHVYTGRCTILGSYANRYVRCTGDYSPAAEEDAWKLANLCSSTYQPLAECRGVYGTYFW